MEELIKNGRIALAARHNPPLKAGDYELDVEGDLNIDKVGAPNAKTARLRFRLECERAALPPGEVYSTYPPAEFYGEYENCLPHIIIKRRSFPWEIPFDAGGGEGDPWVALLVFKSGEGVSFKELSGEQAGDCPPGQETYLPGCYDEIIEQIKADKARCEVADIPAGLFCAILPKASELSLLAHTRNVSLHDKVTDASVKDSWFSCVTANRLPAPTEDGGSVEHTACLISLEGLGPLTGGDRAEKLGDKRFVRVFALYRWRFFCESDGIDFGSLARSLVVGVMQPKQIEKADFSSDENTRARLNDILARGYFPVDHIMREGSRAASWYRTPLIPYPVTNQINPASRFADELLRYDPQLDMLDITYSAAWQLGRLTALQNRQFASELVRWRQENKLEAAADYNRLSLSSDLRLALSISYDEDGDVPWNLLVENAGTICGVSSPAEAGSSRLFNMDGGAQPPLSAPPDTAAWRMIDRLRQRINEEE